MTCTCQAGQSGIWCKHRTALLDGEIDALVSKNLAELNELDELASRFEIDGRDRTLHRRKRVAHDLSK
jgi:uncharacterized Zn finger protein